MVTLKKIGSQYNYEILEIVGSSSDEKPTDMIENKVVTNGSKFTETDTGIEYIFDAESKVWTVNASSSSSGGASGKDGITPKLQKSETAIQVSYNEGESYEDLVLLSELKGDKGDAGKDGAKGIDGKNGEAGAPGNDGVTPKLQKTESAIRVSYNNGDSYEDLIQLSDLKGEKGTDGQNGAKGEPGTNGENGKDGASIKSIKLVKDGTGQIISGTATLTDLTEVEITIETE